MMRRLIQVLIKKSFIRYLVVGGLAFGVEFGSFLLLYWVAGIHLVLANAGSFCLGLLTSFALNRLWTFTAGQYKWAIQHQFGYYVALALLNLLATVAIVSWLRSLGMSPTIGKLLAMITTSLWNFFFYKHAIFRHFSVASAAEGKASGVS